MKQANGISTHSAPTTPSQPRSSTSGIRWNPSSASLSRFLADGYNKLRGCGGGAAGRRRRTASVTIKQELGLISVTAYLIGGVIGPGIFISPAGVLKYTGSVGMALLVWALSGVLATMIALCFAELGTSFPHSGSSYIYVKLAFGDAAAFLFEWIEVFLRKSTSLVIRYLTFAVYILQPFYPTCDIPPVLVFLVAGSGNILISIINSVGLKWRAGFQIVTTVAKCAALALIVVLGLHYSQSGQVDSFQAPFEGTQLSFGAIAMSFSYGLYAYSGWDIMNSAVEEIKDVNRTLPLSIIISMTIVTIVNVLTNVAYFAALSVDEILDSKAVAVVFAKRFLSIGVWLMSLSVSISTIGSCNANLFQLSRYYFAIAREKQLPRFLATVHPKHNTPQPAIIVVCIVIMMCLAVAKDINQLLAYYAVLKWTMVAFPIGAQIYLRYKYPHIHRPLKLPLVLPIVTFCLLILFLVVPIQQNWFNAVVALVLSTICAPVYLFFFYWKNKPIFLQKLLSSTDDGMANFTQKLLLVRYTDEVKHIDCESLLSEETQAQRRLAARKS